MVTVSLPHSFLDLCMGTHVIDEATNLVAVLKDGRTVPFSLNFGLTHFKLHFDLSGEEKMRNADEKLVIVQVEKFVDPPPVTEDLPRTTTMNNMMDTVESKVMAIDDNSGFASEPCDIIKKEQMPSIQTVVLEQYTEKEVTVANQLVKDEVPSIQNPEISQEGKNPSIIADVSSNPTPTNTTKSYLVETPETEACSCQQSVKESLEIFGVEVGGQQSTDTLSKLDTFSELKPKEEEEFILSAVADFESVEYFEEETFDESELQHLNETSLSERDLDVKEVDEEGSEREDEDDVEATFSHFCKLCGHECKTSIGLKQHMLKLHSVYKCKFCDEHFNDFVNLREHTKTHQYKSPRPFQCNYCWLSFSKRSSWEAHEHNHLVKEPYACSKCSKRFKSKELLNMHLKNHNFTANQSGFQCSFCGKKFTLRCRWKQHEAQHMGVKSYECPVCKKAFAVQSSMMVHQRQHYDPSTWPFSCDECGEKFVSKQKLKRHEAKHTGERPFPCAICGKGFAQEPDCKRHEETHSTDRHHPCSYCHMWFKRAIHLKQHEKLHKGIMPFDCNHCGRKFATKQSLMQHERTKHTKELPFKCDVCFKGFALKSILTQHMKKHAAQIFECYLCYKKFAVHSALHQHQKAHKTPQSIFCKYCDKVYNPLNTSTPATALVDQSQIMIEVVGENTEHIQKVVNEVVIN